jgi:hypothetical protein
MLDGQRILALVETLSQEHGFDKAAGNGLGLRADDIGTVFCRASFSFL